MGTVAIILTIIAGGAFWQYMPKLIELIFKRKSDANSELKADGLAFRQYLLDENKNLQIQMQTLITSNETLSKQLIEVKTELDITVKLLEAKDKAVIALTSEVNKLTLEVEILNGLLKK